MRDSTARLDDAALTVETRLSQLLARARERSRGFSAPYMQLWESLEQMAQGGKKIRPRILMDAYEALGGVDERTAVEAACAVELLHMGLVIHDDVIDKDVMRRGEMNITGRFASEAMLRGVTRRDAHAWGEASSILAGDLALTMAHSLLARLDVRTDTRLAVLDLFEETIFESAAGEHYDVWLSMHLQRANPEDVVTMAEQKTGAYSFYAPLVLAATLAEASNSLVDDLSAIGRTIGVIYQLRDDVLGLFGDERDTGKSSLSDLREGKETLLIAHARADPAWEGVESLFGSSSLDAADGHRLRNVIEESGALVFVESLIAERCEQAHRQIDDAALPAALREQLTELIAACNLRAS